MTATRHGIVSALAVAVATASCWSPDREFGATCVETDDCLSGDVCLSGRCVPARQPGDAGEGCGNALRLGVLAPGGSPLVREAQLAGAHPDSETACGEQSLTDVAFTFDVVEPVAVRIRAEGARDVALSLRPLTDGSCGAEDVDACSTSNELLREDLAPQSWAVIVSDIVLGAGAVDEQVRVVVEPVDCPPGYLPFGDGECAGFHAVSETPVARARAHLTALPDGRAVISGGVEADLALADTAQVFDPMTETWSFLTTNQRRPEHSVGLLGGSFVMVGGGPGPQILRQEHGGDVVDRLDFNSSEIPSGSFGMNTDLLAAGLPSGTLAVVGNYGSNLLRVIRPTVACIAGSCMEPSAVCVAGPNDDGDPFIDGICLCPDGPCLDPPVLGDLHAVGGEHPEGAAGRARPLVSAVRGGREFVLLHDSARVYELDVAAAFWRSLPVIAREDVQLVPSDRGVLVVGGREGGVVSARVESVDFATRAPPTIPPLRHARAGHALARLHDGRVLVLGGVDEQGRALDSVELVDPITGAISRMPRLPRPLATVRAATLDDGRVLIVGADDDDGLMTNVLVFQQVPRGSAAPPPPAPTCGVIVPIVATTPTGETPAFTTEETTLGERDRYRDAACGRVFDVQGPERLFSFTVQQTASFTAETDLPRTAFVLWRGTCAQHEVLGCVATDSSSELPDVAMLAPSLPPGDYLLAVEAHDDDETALGIDFDLTTRLGEEQSCPLGAEDPTDDSPAGARVLETVTDFDDPEIANVLGTTGTLCRGDVDHVVVERWSTDSLLLLTNAARDLSTITPAVIDDDATMAAGTPVYQLGTPRPFDDGEGAPGIYLVTLAVGAQDALLHHWSLDLSPRTCVPDQVDSLAQVLDDGNLAARRALLPPSGILERCLTSDLDLDVTVATLPQDQDVVVAFEGDWNVEVQPFALAAPDAPLGLALGGALVPGAVAIMPAGTAPFLALVARNTDDSSGFYRLVVTSSDASEACTTATPLPDTGALDYDSDLYPARLDPEDLGDCTGFSATGSEMVGSLSLREGDRLDASLTPTDGGDVSLYLLTSCLVGAPVCVAGSDVGYSGDQESLTYTHSGLEQTLYLVGDSYDTVPYTATLSWTVIRAGQ
ncbi:MAG: hypothetical protein HYS27_12720 [Deltaproteobacteria bacterium]|nr:hypothetical protein [Deltaproteobacteria bacterium]